MDRLPPTHTPTWDSTCNPGMCHDWESNQQSWCTGRHSNQPSHPARAALLFCFVLFLRRLCQVNCTVVQKWNQVCSLGYQKVLVVFFCKIKDTFSIFTNIFIDLDILSMSTLSHYWFLAGRGQGCCQTSSNAHASPTAKR